MTYIIGAKSSQIKLRYASDQSLRKRTGFIQNFTAILLLLHFSEFFPFLCVCSCGSIKS